MKDIFGVLRDLNIPYEKHEHPAVFTVEEASKYMKGGSGSYNKSLLLRNKKGDVHYLIITVGSKRMDLKKIAELLNDKKLSFASADRMMKLMGLTPGSVSPFGLINDVDHVIQVVVDEDLMVFDEVGFHPNINTATIVMKKEDFKKFLEWTGNKVMYMKL